MADALHYAHLRGVLHRDVKPSNILIDEQGTPWLTDFGLAKLVTESQDGTLTEQGDVLGTLRYMAPENLRGKADARSDVFSLGLTLLELVTLQQAFDTADRDELLQRRLRAEAPAFGPIDAAVPRDLVTILHKAIEVDPAARYQAAGELADDLQRFLRDEPIHARSTGSPMSELRRGTSPPPSRFHSCSRLTVVCFRRTERSSPSPISMSCVSGGDQLPTRCRFPRQVGSLLNGDRVPASTANW